MPVKKYRNHDERMAANREAAKRNYYRRKQGIPSSRPYGTTTADKQRLIAEARAVGCHFCGELEPVCLDFHHRNPAEKVFNIASCGNGGITVEMVAAEIAKCEVVCANCHRKLHAGLLSLT